MLYSNRRHTTTDRANLGLHIWLRVTGLVLLVLLFGVTTPVFSQETGQKVKPSSSATVNIFEIEKREKENPPSLEQKKVENESFILPSDLPVPRGAKGATLRVPPGARITGQDQTRMKTSQSGLQPDFPAIGDNGTTIPPDMGGAAGPNHVMTALNSQVRIQDKTGTVISTVTLNGFFSPLGGSPAVFDPKVLYDPFAGRWIITAPANSVSANSSLLIAVSSTSDPTNPWTMYSYDVDSTNARWFDYPSIGFNKNWIVVTGTLFPVSAGPTNAQVYIFDKAALYAGPTAPSVLIRPQSEGYVMCPAVTLDNSINTEYLVVDYNSNSGGNGYLRISTVTGTPAVPVYTFTILMPNVNQPWNSQSNPPFQDFAPQATVPQKIMNNDSRMQNVVYQNGSLWCAQSAFLPAASPTHTVVQWWQIDPISANTLQFGRVEDPSGNNFYAFPSIAVNAYNDVLLGYSSFSAAQFASCNYSFRLHTDPPNTMQTTVQFKAGLAKYYKTYGSGRNRWGDYSSTCVDPDNFSFWTIQEYAELPSGSDRWGTEWNRVVPPVPNLYVKDRPEDLGAEPNPSTLPMWQSEDIWLRKQQDGYANPHAHQDAEFRLGTSKPNYIYVEVHNRGGVPSAGTEQLTLYWAKASAGLSWPDPWNGGIYFDPGPNTMLMGQPIGTVTIPVTLAGQSSILEYPWNPPDPGIYAAAFGTDQNHFCLLARVTTSATVPGMTFPEITGDFYGNVQRNNRIAWKNIEVYDLLPGVQEPVHAVIANLGTQKMTAKLRFTAVGADGKSILFEKGILKVTTGGNIVQNGVAGDGARATGAGAFEIVKDGGFLQNILLKPGKFETLQITFVPNNPAEKMTGYAVTVTQLEMVKGPDRIVGGQTFVFGTVTGFGTSPGGGVVTGCVPAPDTTLVAWYPFDEKAGTTSADLAAGNTATRIGPTPITGLVRRGLHFDGLNNYVEAPSTVVTNFGPAGSALTCSGGYSTCMGDFTIDAWIRISADAPGSVMVVLDKRKESSGSIVGYSFFLTLKRLGLQLADGGFSNYTSTPLPTLTDGAWHHVAVTVSRLNHKGIMWYHNGVPVDAESNDPTNHPGSLVNDSPLRIGTRTAASPLSGWFKGDIDELEIFNRVLTPAEVRAIFAAGPAGKCK